MNKAIQSLAVNIPRRPDMEDILATLEANITNNGDATRIWTDIITAGTGSFIMRAVASVGSDLAFALERAQHEAYLGIARRPSSIYAGARMLGVHIQRKIPSTVTARIARSVVFGTKVIPAYSSWTVNGIRFVNRQRIFFAQDVEFLDINLQRGVFVSESFISDGKARQSFLFGPTGFKVSDEDVLCYVISPENDGNSSVTEYKVIKEGLWEYPATSRATQVTTAVDGRCKGEFGNGISGYIPPFGHTIRYDYIVVQPEANITTLSDNINPIPADSPVFCLSDNQVGGLTSGVLSDVTNERDPGFYARNAPYIRSGKKFGNTRDNMRALALEYPGVIDAVILGQAEKNPSDLRWMNTLEACLLTKQSWSTSEKNQFIRYMHERSCSSRHFIISEAAPVTMDFKIRIRMAERAQKENVQNQIRNIIDKLFILNDQSLGAMFSVEQLGADILNKVTDPYGKLVLYSKIITPQDTQLAYNQYFVKGSVDLDDTAYDPRDGYRIVGGVTVPGDRIGITG